MKISRTNQNPISKKDSLYVFIRILMQRSEAAADLDYTHFRVAFILEQ